MGPNAAAAADDDDDAAAAAVSDAGACYHHLRGRRWLGGFNAFNPNFPPFPAP